MRLSDLDRLVTPERIRNYSIMLIAGYAIGLSVWMLTLHADMDANLKPFGYDFITFYAASKLALHGELAQAYIPRTIFLIERSIVPAGPVPFLWHYPPVFGLVILPLALAPYKLAYFIWVSAGLGFYLWVVRSLTSHPWALLVAAAFPAVCLNVFHGQNAFFNTALLGFGLSLLHKRPWIAGLVLGALIYKPQFGVFLPFLFAADRNGKAFLGASLSAALLMLASFYVFGASPWIAFFENAKIVRALLEHGNLPWPKIPTWFVTFSYLGIPQAFAYALHGLTAAALGILTLMAWRRPGPQVLKVSLVVLSILAVSPYMFDYDLVLLAIPIALLGSYSLDHEVPSGTRIALVVAFITPMIFLPAAIWMHLQLMPVAILVFYGAIWRSLAKSVTPATVENRPAAWLKDPPLLLPLPSPNRTFFP